MLPSKSMAEKRKEVLARMKRSDDTSPPVSLSSSSTSSSELDLSLEYQRLKERNKHGMWNAVRRELKDAALMPPSPQPLGQSSLEKQLKKLQIDTDADLLKKFRLPEVRAELKNQCETLQRFRPKYKVFKQSPGRCCCNRPPQLIMCIGCGFFKKGNINFQCPEHPRHFFSIMVNVCDKCGLPHLLRETEWLF